jgi:hypothetical protein
MANNAAHSNNKIQREQLLVEKKCCKRLVAQINNLMQHARQFIQQDLQE